MGRLYDRFLRKLPRQSRSRSVVEAILTAAVEAATRANDDDAVSVNRTAERAGVGIGSLYDYFHDRDGLVAVLAAKFTEDNLEAFEALLRETQSLPIRKSVERIADLAFRTYTATPMTSRITMRAAHRVGLMPALAANQAGFARSLAVSLRQRPDVRTDCDYEALTFVATNGLMGVMVTLLWLDERDVPLDVVREALVDMLYRTLAADAARGAEPERGSGASR